MNKVKSAGHQVEKVFLNDLKINFLQINDNYKNRTLATQEDDAPAVVNKMIRADVIVMASPYLLL